MLSSRRLACCLCLPEARQKWKPMAGIQMAVLIILSNTLKRLACCACLLEAAEQWAAPCVKR